MVHVDRTRRRLLVSTSALAGVSAFGLWPAIGSSATLEDTGQPFTFESLIADARQRAAAPYETPQPRYPDVLDTVGYDAFMGIHADSERALWANSPRPFAVEFFHLDQNARDPVNIHVVRNGRSRRLRYEPGLFRYDDPSLRDKLPDDLGFAGFRLTDTRHDGHEWLAFKGASYFRSPGALNQYGLSARGVAADTGYGDGEPFPRFTDYWLSEPAPGDDAITIYALLQGEHLTGAYRMVCRRPGEVVMDNESHLFQRTPLRRLGIAPITSMFWFSETNARRGSDWRPEIHDSDGLAMTTGVGAHIWRPLTNPPRIQYSAFADDNPRGFGLLQRDRNFDHYQAGKVGFEKRPSLWVEPKGDWGRGHVGLLELPTDDEIYDNINAFWVPEDSSADGQEWRFDYRLRWTDQVALDADLARVVATRTGRAGAPGTYADQPPLARKFVIDFEGGPLAGQRDAGYMQSQVEAASGEIINPYVRRIEATGGWRVFFDWRGDAPDAERPIELKCVLMHGNTPLSETWTYAYVPQPLPSMQPDSGDVKTDR